MNRHTKKNRTNLFFFNFIRLDQHQHHHHHQIMVNSTEKLVAPQHQHHFHPHHHHQQLHQPQSPQQSFTALTKDAPKEILSVSGKKKCSYCCEELGLSTFEKKRSP